jgi:hypothetical protein
MHATKSVNLEDTMRKISQTLKDKCMIPLISGTRGGKFIETENRIEATRGWGKGDWAVQVSWELLLWE